MCRTKLLTVVLTSSLVFLFATSTVQANSMLMKMSEDEKQWVMPTGNYENHRYSELDQINTGNVKNLKVAWTFSTGVLRGHEGNPLVIGDMMYLHTPFPHRVFALDLNDDQRIVWAYEPRPNDYHVEKNNYAAISPTMCCDHVNRGVAYGDGKIFLYRADATLVALNAKTGKVEWEARNGEVAAGATGTAAPMVVKDKVYVGISGGEFGVRGHLTAYDIKTGKQVWRGYSMGPDSDTLMGPDYGGTTHLGRKIAKNESIAEDSWKGDAWKIGGGTTWGWFSYDSDANLVYYGTGNPSTWNPVVRPGDNKWSMTIFARDADTGHAKWVYQMTPFDEWDYDGINEMILADIEVDGKMRKTLVHFDRNGFGYTLDRVTGELLVAEKFDDVVNWATSINMETGRPNRVAKYSTAKNGEDYLTKDICPAALGTKDQQPAAFSPETKVFYVPTNHVCMNYEPTLAQYVRGQAYVGANLDMFPAPTAHGKTDRGEHMGRFIAWDAGKGEELWAIDEKFSVWSGALATAGDVVFYGTLEGHLKAVEAKTGKELYSFKMPSGIIGNVMTYEHGGKQYVAVFSGIGGWAGIGMAAGLTEDRAGLGAVGGYRGLNDYTRLGGSLFVFSL